MSLYNMLFGVNKTAPVLLATIGLTTSDIPRFRDCYIHEDKIVIYTRTGGGNRDYYEDEETCRDNYPEYFVGDDQPSGPWNSTLQQNSFYLYDEDDDFDCTYVYFYFKFPEDYADDLKAIASNNETYTPTQKWQDLFANLTANTNNN
jgi:hypothetical protein